MVRYILYIPLSSTRNASKTVHFKQQYNQEKKITLNDFRFSFIELVRAVFPEKKNDKKNMNHGLDSTSSKVVLFEYVVIEKEK